MNKITTVVAKNATSETIAAIGIDLARNVFAVHAINAAVRRKYAQERTGERCHTFLAGSFRMM